MLVLSQSIETLAGIGFESGFQTGKVAAMRLVIARRIGMRAVTGILLLEDNRIITAFQKGYPSIQRYFCFYLTILYDSAGVVNFNMSFSSNRIQQSP